MPFEAHHVFLNCCFCYCRCFCDITNANEKALRSLDIAEKLLYIPSGARDFSKEFLVIWRLIFAVIVTQIAILF
jgi:hypothetical protein